MKTETASAEVVYLHYSSGEKMIIQNEIPILEYDDSSKEVITPNHDCTNLHLPEKCVFAFLGDRTDDYALLHDARIIEEFVTISKIFNIYVLSHKGEDICLVQSPIGAASAVQLLDMLLACGCRKVIATGSCGVLADLPENAFLIPIRALRDEGTSYKYLPASRYIDLCPDAVEAIADTFNQMGIPYEKCMTWTTDGYFRETEDMVRFRLTEGCAAVEMECAALAACAKKRGGRFGQFLFTADSLANVHEYDQRKFGYDSHEKALLLALDIVSNW